VSYILDINRVRVVGVVSTSPLQLLEQVGKMEVVQKAYLNYNPVLLIYSVCVCVLGGG